MVDLDKITLKQLTDLFGEVVRQIKIANLDPEYWELVVLDVDTTTEIPAGQSKSLLFERERGKLIALSTTLDNPNALIEIKIDEMKFRGTFTNLYDYGLIGFNPTTFWISRYDTTNNVYTGWMTPIPPRDYFGEISFTIYAPSTSSVSLIYSAYRYKLKEEKVKKEQARAGGVLGV